MVKKMFSCPHCAKIIVEKVQDADIKTEEFRNPNCPYCGKIIPADVWAQAPSPEITCHYCEGQKIYKDGIRYTTTKEIQRYLCRVCGYRFSNP